MILPDLHAQSEIKADDLFEHELSRKGRFYMVPEIGLWFGTYTNLEAAPQIAYHFTDRWSLGAGPHYTFYKNNSYYSTVNFSTHMWGIKAFTRYSIIRSAQDILPFYLFDELFAHVEYERMSLESKYFNSAAASEADWFWINYFYIGAGISQQIKGNTSYFFMLLWNLDQTIYSLNRNPTYRIGFSIYF
jgi:hypothetical protein